MKRFQVKTVTWYAIVGLLVAVAVLPILKSMAPQFFPEGFRSRKSREGYEDSGCRGVTCEEGQFCTNAKCVPRYVGSAQVPEGNE